MAAALSCRCFGSLLKDRIIASAFAWLVGRWLFTSCLTRLIRSEIYFPFAPARELERGWDSEVRNLSLHPWLLRCSVSPTHRLFFGHSLKRPNCWAEVFQSNLF